MFEIIIILIFIIVLKLFLVFKYLFSIWNRVGMELGFGDIVDLIIEKLIM